MNTWNQRTITSFLKVYTQYVHGKDSATDRLTLKRSVLFLSHSVTTRNLKICFTALKKCAISTNFGHKAGGAFSGRRALTIERSLMSGCGQGHETLDTKLQSHETKPGMESLSLSYISFFLKQLLQPKVSLVPKRWIK